MVLNSFDYLICALSTEVLVGAAKFTVDNSGLFQRADPISKELVACAGLKKSRKRFLYLGHTS